MLNNYPGSNGILAVCPRDNVTPILQSLRETIRRRAKKTTEEKKNSNSK